MKILRFKSDTGPKCGVAVGERVCDISSIYSDDTLAIIRGGGDALKRLADFSASNEPTLALRELHLLAPVPNPGKFLAIGMNYRKHRAEAEKLGVARQQHQVWFNKQTTCICGPFEDIDPGVSEQLDYEVELGVVIGVPAKRVSRSRAGNHVFGYFVMNDVSARDWQFHSPTFTVGKSFDTHGPIGPWIVTKDEVEDPHRLDLRCLVNGELRQSSNTSQMVHDIFEQIEYLSTAFTLSSGDLIATGTPEGIGMARNPQVFLQSGDVVRCEIDGIGAIENRVSGSSPSRQPLPP